MPFVQNNARGTKRRRDDRALLGPGALGGADAARNEDCEQNAPKRRRREGAVAKGTASMYFFEEYEGNELIHHAREERDFDLEEKTRQLLPYHQLPPPQREADGTCIHVQHPDWWYRDGDVIISVSRTLADPQDRILFKLHRATLGDHLDPFHTLFEIDLPGGPEDTMDDVPVILAYTDTAVQWSLMCLLRQCHDRQEFKFDVLYDDVVDLLHLSDKYQCLRFREAAVWLLSSAFPTKLENWRKKNAKSRIVGGPSKAIIHIYTDMVLRYNIPEILPALRLSLSGQSPAQLIRGWPDGNGGVLRLPREEVFRIIRGRERLVKARQDVIFETFKNFRLGGPERGLWAYCDRQSGHGNLCKLWLSRLARDWERRGVEVYHIHSALRILGSEARHAMKKQLCEMCWRVFKQRLTRGQRKVWQSLPYIFGMGDWFEVEKRAKIARETLEWSIGLENSSSREPLVRHVDVVDAEGAGGGEMQWWSLSDGEDVAAGPLEEISSESEGAGSDTSTVLIANGDAQDEQDVEN
ncbi:hypothetical protein BV25DRAFT_1994624 [Artomyces pyxidatus]|uniref:Uncharacterized protein n=1 Tax=Artomyces pyxidatus TaxID=48021 RepID=A0ACB8SNI3_9AGAM|nr:hypothetical protein BV25DRAFT_1994624 [Artomyces pyxidatus]